MSEGICVGTMHNVTTLRKNRFENKTICSLISELSVNFVQFIIFDQNQKTADRQSFCFEIASIQLTVHSNQLSFLLLTYLVFERCCVSSLHSKDVYCICNNEPFAANKCLAHKQSNSLQ